jgi:non-canonical purine NTP pyrophosphatase (RdgB/HAM1 family)
MNVTFVTENQHKAEYLSKMFDIAFDHQKLNLEELQTTNLAEIARHKANQAYDILKVPVLIDDVSLGFDALEGLPGPFIKFFTEINDGLEKLCRMLDGLQDRNAVATCVMAYCDETGVEIFQKSLKGTISDHPKGDGGFGWDKIFIPDGYDVTRAELTAEDDENTYVSIKPISEVKRFLTQRGYGD